MYSYGPLHMAVQKQGGQLEPIYISSVRIRDIALGTYWKRWTKGRGSERGTGISALMARQDDIYIYIYIYIYIWHEEMTYIYIYIYVCVFSRSRFGLQHISVIPLENVFSFIPFEICVSLIIRRLIYKSLIHTLSTVYFMLNSILSTKNVRLFFSFTCIDISCFFFSYNVIHHLSRIFLLSTHVARLSFFIHLFIHIFCFFAIRVL